MASSMAKDVELYLHNEIRDREAIREIKVHLSGERTF